MEEFRLVWNKTMVLASILIYGFKPAPKSGQAVDFREHILTLVFLV